MLEHMLAMSCDTLQ